MEESIIIDHISADTVFTVRCKIYGDGGDGFVLYEDDFETFAYEQGRQNKVCLSVDEKGRLKAERIGEEKARYNIIF